MPATTANSFRMQLLAICNWLQGPVPSLICVIIGILFIAML